MKFFVIIIASSWAQELELKDLAYEIEHHKKGYYVWLLVEATPETLQNSTVLSESQKKSFRYIVVKEGE